MGELPKWVNRGAGVGSAIAGGLEKMVSLKQNFRRSKAVAAGDAEGVAPELEPEGLGGGI